MSLDFKYPKLLTFNTLQKGNFPAS